MYNGDQLQTGASNISGSEPTTESSTPFWQDANYYLKYMYSLTTSEVQNFLTTDFMPVSNTANAVVDRGVYVFSVTTAGSSYPNGTYYSPLRGDGTGGKISIVVAGGVITEFGSNNSTNSYMYAPGSGYSFANVSLAATNIFTDNSCSTVISGATATAWGNASAGVVKPMIEPKGGHGKDDIAELGGHYIMVQGKFEPTDTDATQVNDFRRVGLLKNPFATSTGAVSTLSTARQTRAVILAGSITTNYQADELVTQATTGAQGRVVEFDATNKILYIVQEKYTTFGLDTNGNLTLFSGNNAITGSTSSASYSPNVGYSGTTNTTLFASGYSVPELTQDTGEVLYVENRRAISRASDQTEDIKVVVEF